MSSSWSLDGEKIGRKPTSVNLGLRYFTDAVERLLCKQS